MHARRRSGYTDVLGVEADALGWTAWSPPTTPATRSTSAALRREYGDAGLDAPDLAADPVAMFRRWLDDTVAAGLHEPNAMVVSTVSAEGRSSSRMVLLKGARRARVRLLHQLRLAQGATSWRATRTVALLLPVARAPAAGAGRGQRRRRSPREESEAYFATRPRGSQLGAWASPQSRWSRPRAELDDARTTRRERRFADQDGTAPPHWGGFRVAPEMVEFWQGRRGRMHDRLVYRRTEGGWITERLAP